MSRPSFLTSRRWLEVLVAALIAVVAVCASWRGSELVGSAMAIQDRAPFGYDAIWFDGDVEDIFYRLTERGFEQTLTARHPLLSLIVRAPVRLTLKAIPGTDPVWIVRLVMASSAALWATLLFVVLRIIGCRLGDATLFVLLGVGSAAAMFWFVVPETFALGSVAILPALALVGMTNRGPARQWPTVLVSALTLSITVTNWMFGVVATIVLHPWRRAVQLTANALCLVLVLWGAQKFIYPSATFPYGCDASYRAFVLSRDMGTSTRPITAFLFHGMIMPFVSTTHRINQSNYPVLTVQRSSPGSGSIFGKAALVSWIGVLALGVAGLWSNKVHQEFRIFLVLMLFGQLVLHLVFGEETFLYSLHYLPLLVVLGSLGTLTRTRFLSVALASVLLVSAGLNNGLQFARSLELARQITSGAVK